MDDFKTVNDIISQAVESTSYSTVLISSGIFILYTLIIRLVDYFKSKDRNKPIIEMASAIKEVSENVVRLNNILDKTFKDAEIKESDKIKNVITLGCNAFKNNVMSQCSDIIIHNNIIANREAINHNIIKLVSTEYYKFYAVLSAYQINDINVATKLKEEWIEEIAEESLDIIYNGQNAVDRIRQLDIRLQITADEYSVYINNKVFNH